MNFLFLSAKQGFGDTLELTIMWGLLNKIAAITAQAYQWLREAGTVGMLKTDSHQQFPQL